MERRRAARRRHPVVHHAPTGVDRHDRSAAAGVGDVARHGRAAAEQAMPAAAAAIAGDDTERGRRPAGRGGTSTSRPNRSRRSRAGRPSAAGRPGDARAGRRAAATRPRSRRRARTCRSCRTADRQLLQAGGEAIDELGTDGRHQRRAVAVDGGHQLADGERRAAAITRRQPAQRATPARPAVGDGGAGMRGGARARLHPGDRSLHDGRNDRSKRSRNSRAPRPLAPCGRTLDAWAPVRTAATLRAGGRRTGDGARRRRRADGPRGRRPLPGARRPAGARRRPTAQQPPPGWRPTEPDLVVLDIMLPGIDGLTILRQLRADGDVPVILLTARADEVDRVVGLELGADDYVVKPFSPRELAARVRTVLRARVGASAGTDATGAVEFGGLRSRPATREVTVDGRRRGAHAEGVRPAATRSPARPGRCSHAASCSPRCGTRRPSTRTRRRSPCTSDGCARRSSADPERPRWITTAWGVGYRFEP